MPRFVVVIASIALVVHGFIHLMGTAVYMKLGKVEGLSYKTTVLGGRWDLGEDGIRTFGALWAVAAVGFALAAVALMAGCVWWPPVLVGVVLLSLVLTILDGSQAFGGAIVDVLILAALWLGPLVAAWLAR